MVQDNANERPASRDSHLSFVLICLRPFQTEPAWLHNTIRVN